VTVRCSLTHNQAPSHEWYNHLADSMYPLRPICINGVTATGGEAGKMAKHYCVTQWWKWKGLPYMALPEHPEDQGFIVCESDFVFTQEQATRMTSAVDAAASGNGSFDARLEEMCADAPDTVAGRRFITAVNAWHQETRARPRSAVPWPCFQTPRQPHGVGEDNLIDALRGNVPHTGGRTGHFSETIDIATMAPPAQRRPAAAFRPEHVRSEVQDITDYFNLAAKDGGIDDVLWCGWNAEQWTHGSAKRQRSPSSGAHLLLLTAKCARKLLPVVQACKDMHMGSTIKLKWLQDWRDTISGGYIVPPIGGYYTHISTTEKNG
jgi:hypothetical protein